MFRPHAQPVGPVTLEGRLVRLVPLQLDHVDALLAAANETDDEQFPFTWAYKDREGQQRYVEEAVRLAEQRKAVPFATLDARTGRVVGTTRFANLERWNWRDGQEHRPAGGIDAAEIGWTWLCRSAQRTGINTEAKLLMLRHAFEVWQLHRVFLKTDARNLRSRGAMARLGFTFEGVWRANMPSPEGALRNSAYFSVLEPEWPRVRAHIEALLRREPAPAQDVVRSRANAEHYVWGEVCDGWRLADRDDLSVIEERVPSGASEVRHLHDRARQFFYVLSGVASLELRGTTHRLSPGQGLEVPPGAPHRLFNDGPEDAVFLVISAPTTRGDRIESR